MRYRHINRHISSRYGVEEIRRRILASDITAIDLDDCLYPRNSHVELTKNMFLDLPYSYRKVSDLKYMTKVLKGLTVVLYYFTGKLLRTHLSNRFLLEQYERVMRNMPVHYFEKCAVDLPRRIYRKSLETIMLLSGKMTVGIITVGLDMIAGEFKRQLSSDGATISFVDANRATFSENQGEPLYTGFDREDSIITAHDKWHRLVRRLDEYGASRPVIIGHRADEILMARKARKMGGISIGFNPDLDVEKQFDIVVKGRDWTPLYHLLNGIIATSGGINERKT